MALINCPECRTEVSDSEPDCPNCGADIVTWALEHASPSPMDAGEERRPASKIPKIIFWVVSLALVGITGGLSFRMIQAQNKAKEEVERLQHLPEMPVQMIYGNAQSGAGKAVSFKNTSKDPLAVAVTIRHPSKNEQKSFDFDLPPGETREIGALEGWTFASGDTVRITHNDYKTLNGNVP